MSGVENELHNLPHKEVFGPFFSGIEEILNHELTEQRKRTVDRLVNIVNVITAWGYSYRRGGWFEDDDHDYDLLGRVDMSKLQYIEIPK